MQNPNFTDVVVSRDAEAPARPLSEKLGLTALTALVALALLAAPRPAAAQLAASVPTARPIHAPIPNGPVVSPPASAPAINPGAFQRSLGGYKPWLNDVEVVHEVATGRTLTAPARMRTPMESAAAGQLFNDDRGSNGTPGAGPYTERFPELQAQAAREANPVSPPMPAPGEGGEGGVTMGERKIFGADNRIRITPTNYFPARAQCRLLMRYPNGNWAQGSGTMIGYKYVLTAGHVVYSSDNGGWATNIYVYPGQDGGALPYGSAYATHLRSVTGWTNSGSSDYDYGLITLNRAVGNTTGWFGLASFSDGTLDSTGTAYITGYPGEKPATQWQHWGPITDNDSTMVYYRIDTTPGQSGSGVYRFYNGNNRYVFAVHTGWSWHFDWFSSGDYNHGTRITSARFNQIIGWMNSGY